jgi:hypothetical protein
VIGHAPEHSHATYKFFHPIKKTIWISRNITWLNFQHLDPKQDLSIFVQDPELREMPMGINDFEVVTSELSLLQPTVIPDDNNPELEAGKKSNHDAFAA